MIQAAAAQSPMKLYRGEGDEPDTLGAKAVLVMDSVKFPFFPAEVRSAITHSHVRYSLPRPLLTPTTVTRPRTTL